MNAATGLTPKTIKGYRGLYYRGNQETCPPDHLTDCYNCIFPGKDQVSIREPIEQSSTGLLNANVISFAIAQVAAGAGLLTLGSNGDLIDETHATTLANFPGADDFKCLNIYGRSYIAPTQYGKAWGVSGLCNTVTFFPGYSSTVTLTSGTLNNYVLGGGILINGVPCSIIAWSSNTSIRVDNDFGTLNGIAYACSNVYVYNGATLVPAGGQKPSPAYSINDWGFGSSTAGWHAITWCYQYKNGTLSPPFNSGILAHNFAGSGAAIVFSDVPPTNVVSRVLLSTQAFNNPGAITMWTMSPAEMFFIPGGTIPKATTTVNISYLDVALISSADYVFDLSPYIPGASSLRFYHGRMIVIGQYSFPDNIIVSDQLIPEQTNQVTGIINMPVDYGLNVSRTAAIIRDVMYIMKPYSTYAVQDNGSDPDTWSVSPIDTALGAYDNGLSVFASAMSAQDIMDTSLVCTTRGLMLFTGIYQDPPLTYKIETLWQRIPAQFFQQCQVAHDVNLKRIYLAVPLTPSTNNLGTDIVGSGGTTSIILMGDYQDGLTADGIKWSIWIYGTLTSTNMYDKIAVENFTLLYSGAPTPIYQLAFCNGANIIYKIVPPAGTWNAVGLVDAILGNYGIYQAVVFPPQDFNAAISSFIMVDMNINGSGLVTLSYFQRNKLITTTKTVIRQFNLSNYTGATYYRLQANMNAMSEGIQLALENIQSSPQTLFSFTDIKLYGRAMYDMRPQQLEST